MYSNFILNLCIVYDLNTWPHNSTNNVTLKDCLFGTVQLTRNADKRKFTCDTARNVITFSVENSSSSYIDSPKNNFLVLDERPTSGINGNVVAAEKNYY